MTYKFTNFSSPINYSALSQYNINVILRMFLAH